MVCCSIFKEADMPKETPFDPTKKWEVLPSPETKTLIVKDIDGVGGQRFTGPAKLYFMDRDDHEAKGAFVFPIGDVLTYTALFKAFIRCYREEIEKARQTIDEAVDHIEDMSLAFDRKLVEEKAEEAA